MERRNDFKVDHDGYKRMLRGKGINIRSYRKLDHVALPAASVTLCDIREKKALYGMLDYDFTPHYREK